MNKYEVHPNVHVLAQVIETNSIKIINAFVRCETGEYIMPKKMLKSGLLLAEGLLRIEETDYACPVTVINPTDYDVVLRKKTEDRKVDTV